MKLLNKNKEYRNLALIVVVAAVFSIFSIATHFAGSIYNFLISYSHIPAAQFLFNFGFLILSGTLLVTYRSWRKSSKHETELENIISSISPDALMIVSPMKRIKFCNGSTKKIFGYDANEVIGHKTELLFYNNRENSDIHSSVNEALHKDGFHIGLATGQKKNGEIIPLEIIRAHLKNSRDDVLLIRDITERVRTQKALGELLRTFREVAQSMPSGLFIYQYIPPDNFILIDGNPKAEEICGMKINDIRGKDVREILPNAKKKRLLEAYWRVLETGESIEADDLYYRDRKLSKALKIRLFPVPGKKIGVAFENVTEQRLWDETQERLIRQLREALTKVKTLRGLLPICASCKKIRDDDGYWRKVEIYVEEHSDAVFSHSLCPDCMRKLYPEIANEIDENEIEHKHKKNEHSSVSAKTNRYIESAVA